MAEHGLNERQNVGRLREVIDVSVVTPEPSIHHDILFYTYKQPCQKSKDHQRMNQTPVASTIVGHQYYKFIIFEYTSVHLNLCILGCWYHKDLHP